MSPPVYIVLDYRLGEESVIFNVCAALLSWLFPSTDETRQALQWWHRRQVDRLHDGAELIRDGILQDLFAIRRTLELSYEEHKPASEANLRQLEALHQRLEQLSNTLSPAFSQDSLPLAIQHQLQQWQAKHPAIAVSAHLPSAEQSSGLGSRVALITLEELLNLVAHSLSSAASIELELGSQGQMTTLTVRVREPQQQQRQAIARLQDLAHLHRSFQFLTDGHSKQAVRGLWVEWQFSWAV